MVSHFSCSCPAGGGVPACESVNSNACNNQIFQTFTYTANYNNSLLPIAYGISTENDTVEGSFIWPTPTPGGEKTWGWSIVVQSEPVPGIYYNYDD